VAPTRISLRFEKITGRIVIRRRVFDDRRIIHCGGPQTEIDGVLKTAIQPEGRRVLTEKEVKL
jgi:hypothetical protein